MLQRKKVPYNEEDPLGRSLGGQRPYAEPKGINANKTFRIFGLVYLVTVEGGVILAIERIG
jgi:hypothetical protein